MYRNIRLQTVRLHRLPKYSTHILKTFTVFLYFTWRLLILKNMSNLCPKRMKWHFRDSRYKISRGRMPLDTLRGLAPSAIKCPFQDSAPAAFQTFRRPCDEFPYFFINCGPAGDRVLTTNRQTEKSYFDTNYITTFILHKLSLWKYPEFLGCMWPADPMTIFAVDAKCPDRKLCWGRPWGRRGWFVL
jgi:hypothetical protein